MILIVRKSILAATLTLCVGSAFADADSYAWCVGFARALGAQSGAAEKGAFARNPADTTLIQKLAEFDKAPAPTIKSNLIRGLNDSQKCDTLPKGSEEAMSCRREQRFCSRKIADVGVTKLN
jgi:hypothetical protein